MAVTITDIMAKQFSPALYMLAQQKQSKFSRRVQHESVTSAEEAFFDTIGVEDDPEQSTTRHGDTPLSESPFGRRKAVPFKWDKGTMLDKYDIKRMQADPQGRVLQAFAASFGRKKDKIIRDAMLGVALVGKTGATEVAFKDETISINGGSSVTVTSLGTLASVGSVADISLAKMLVMLQLFMDDDIDEEARKYWAVSPKDITDMLDLTEVGSADFNTVKALVAGKVETFLGFEFFWTTLLTKDAATSTAYRTIAWVEDGIILATIGEMETEISKRADKKNEDQIYSQMDLGAVRMEGKKIHECLTKVAQ